MRMKKVQGLGLMEGSRTCKGAPRDSETPLGIGFRAFGI